MSESGIGADRQNLGVDVVKIFGAVGESGNFGGTDPSEVHRVKNENNMKCVFKIYYLAVEISFQKLMHLKHPLYFPRY